jgi:hypothetical protein
LLSPNGYSGRRPGVSRPVRVVPVVGELGAQLLRCGQCARRGGEREGK